MPVSIQHPSATAATSGIKSGQGLSARELKSLRQSCRDFEAIYVQEMYKTMRKTVPDSGLFEKDMASELYRDMMDAEIAKSTAAGKGVGIGETMYQQIVSKLSHKK